MPPFVLVHGSGQNAASWSRVGDLLRARGHAVAAPELPKQAPNWGLEDHAAAIAAAIQGPRTVVVAHSLSGAFLPLVPRLRDCALLVFVAAVIPEPGKSIREQFTEDPTMFAADWIAAGPRWFDPSQREVLAREFLFHDCDEDTIARALSTVDPLDPQRLVVEPSPFAQWPDVATASIVPTGDRTLSPQWCRRRSRFALGRTSHEVRGGHCPHVSRPEEIADLLEQLSAQSAAE